MIRDLRGTIEREKAPIGVFLTVYPPSSQMRTEAANAGTYRPGGAKRDYQRIQILTVDDIFRKKRVEFPGHDVTEDEALATSQLSLFDRSAKRKQPKQASKGDVPEAVDEAEESRPIGR